MQSFLKFINYLLLFHKNAPQQICFLRIFHIFTVLRKKLSSVEPIVPWKNSERILFSSHDESEWETICKMADGDGFVRTETLDIFLSMVDEGELDHLFEEKMNNIRREVISYKYVSIYFIRLLWCSRYLALFSFILILNTNFIKTNLILNYPWELNLGCLFANSWL